MSDAAPPVKEAHNDEVNFPKLAEEKREPFQPGEQLISRSRVSILESPKRGAKPVAHTPRSVGSLLTCLQPVEGQSAAWVRVRWTPIYAHAGTYTVEGFVIADDLIPRPLLFEIAERELNQPESLETELSFRLFRATALLELGDYKTALGDFDDLIRAHRDANHADVNGQESQPPSPIIREVLWTARKIRAWIFQQDGDVESSLTDFLAMHAASPDNHEIVLRIACSHAWLDRFDKAEHFFDLAIKLEPNDPQCWLQRGHHWLARARRAVASKPRDPSSYLRLMSNAANDYRTAVNIAPQDGSGLAGLAMLAREKGDNDQAIEIAQKAIASDRDCNNARTQLAAAYIARRNEGDLTRAVECLRQAIEVDRGLELYQALAKALYDLGKPAEALEVSSRVIESHNRIGAAVSGQSRHDNERNMALTYAVRVACLLHLKQHDKAVAEAANAVEQFPDSLSVRRMAVLACARSGDNHMAVHHAETYLGSVEIDADRDISEVHEMHRLLFHLLAAQSQFEKALQATKQWCALFPTATAGLDDQSNPAAPRPAPGDAALAAAAHVARGATLHKLKRQAEAVEAYNVALSFAPASSDALTCRGMAHVELDKNREALQDFSQAIQLCKSETQLRKLFLLRSEAWKTAGIQELADADAKRAGEIAKRLNTSRASKTSDTK